MNSYMNSGVPRFQMRLIVKQAFAVQVALFAAIYASASAVYCVTVYDKEDTRIWFVRTSQIWHKARSENAKAVTV